MYANPVDDNCFNFNGNSSFLIYRPNCEDNFNQNYLAM